MGFSTLTPFSVFVPLIVRSVAQNIQSYTPTPAHPTPARAKTKLPKKAFL